MSSPTFDPLSTPRSERGEALVLDSLLVAGIVGLSLVIAMLLFGVSTSSMLGAIGEGASDLAAAATGLVQDV
jgi:hypothetical protein